jgi:hypothetical protein
MPAGLRRLELPLLFALSASSAFAAAGVPASAPIPGTAVLLPTGVATVQDAGASGFGKLDPTPPTGITPDEIVKKLGEREAEFQRIRNEEYVFTQSVKIDTISEDTNKPDGEYQQVTDITFGEDGKRQEHVRFAPANTIQRVIMSENDFEEIEHRLPFILTTADLPKYDVKYLGKQKVDDLDTYVFEAGPKVIQKKQKYFQGKVWVDQQDFQIVLVNGETVPQDLDGKYWFPTYTHAEATLHFAPQNGSLGEDVHIKSIVKYTDYKRFRAKSRIIYDGQDITDNGTKAEKPPAKP